MRIFGQTNNKRIKMSPRALALQENVAKKKALEEIKKKQEEEEKKLEEEMAA